MNAPYTDYRIKAITRSHRDEVVTLDDGRLAVYTRMPAENNLANLDIILQISRYLGAPQKQVILFRGHNSPNKTIRVYTS